MPIEFDEYRRDRESDDTLAIDPGSNAYEILSFLAEYPDLGFKPAEIAEEVDLPSWQSQSDACSAKRAGTCGTRTTVLVDWG